MQLVNDILIFADFFLEGIQLDGADVRLLRENEGLQHVHVMLESGIQDVRQYKFVILLCGKMDLREADDVFKDSVKATLVLLKQRNPQLITILTAAVLLLGDPRLEIHAAGYRAGWMSRLAEEDVLVEFSRPGKRLLRPGGVIREFYDVRSFPNLRGLEQISRGLEAKFTCAKL